MERRANPFGIAPGDLLMPAVLVIGGIWLIDRLKKVPSDIIDAAAQQAAAQSGVIWVPPPTVTIANVNYPGLMRLGETANIDFQIAHEGSDGGYTVAFDLLGFGGNPYYVAQRIEEAYWSSASAAVAGSATINVGRGLYAVRAFVRNSDGQTMATWPRFGQLPTVFVI